MPLSRPDDLAARWVPGKGPVTVEAAPRGGMNQTWRVQRDGRDYALRLARPLTVCKDLDPSWECRVAKAAAAAGIGPAVYVCEPTLGLSIAAWVPGHAWSAADIRHPDNLDAFVSLLRRLHSLEVPEPARRMDARAWIERYWALALSNAGRIPRESSLRVAAEAALGVVASLPAPTPVVCHSDLHRENIVCGETLVLLDFEYAHVATPFWDLAGWISNNDWSLHDARPLAAGYLARPPSAQELAGLAAWVWLYDYVSLLWCDVHAAHEAPAHADGLTARADVLAERLSACDGWDRDGRVRHRS